jgi:hypothetical protein
MSFSKGFQKTAAPKWIKEFRSGNLSQDALKKVMRQNPKSVREVGYLGRGNEQIAHLVSHPSDGLAVRKTVIPSTEKLTSFDDPALQAKKHHIQKKMRSHGAMAKYYGRDKRRQVSYQEYLKPGGSSGVVPSDKEESIPEEFKKAVKERTGISVGDVGPSQNIMSVKNRHTTTKNGKPHTPADKREYKVFDFMPSKDQERVVASNSSADKDITHRLKTKEVLRRVYGR